MSPRPSLTYNTEHGCTLLTCIPEFCTLLHTNKCIISCPHHMHHACHVSLGPSGCTFTCNSLQGNTAATAYKAEETSVTLGRLPSALQSLTQLSSSDKLQHTCTSQNQHLLPSQSSAGPSNRKPMLAFGNPMIAITPELERQLQVIMTYLHYVWMAALHTALSAWSLLILMCVMPACWKHTDTLTDHESRHDMHLAKCCICRVAKRA